MRLVKKNTIMFRRLDFGVSVLGGFCGCFFLIRKSFLWKALTWKEKKP